MPSPDGGLRLASIQYFSEPRFTPSGWEVSEKTDTQIPEWLIDGDGVDVAEVGGDIVADPKNIERASRRAKQNAFDTIVCNPDLDTFATFTYRPDETLEKSSYDQCYDVLRVWLSNRVQRNGLKYVIVPERHKSGDIHFHGILNSSAVKLERAHSPRTGHALSRNGLPIFNLTDWKAGFSTAQIIGSGENDREKVAKYVFKYMGKQLGARIGGRYALIGGKDIIKPVYVYGDTVEELTGGENAVWERSVDVYDNLQYRELTFL